MSTGMKRRTAIRSITPQQTCCPLCARYCRVFELPFRKFACLSEHAPALLGHQHKDRQGNLLALLGKSLILLMPY